MTSRRFANAALADGSTVPVTIVAGRVVGDDPTVPTEDLSGWTLLTAPAEPHAHLDKALSGERLINRSGDLAGAIDVWSAALPDMTVDNIARRAELAVEMYVANGVTAIRTHVDVSEHVGTSGVEALLSVKEKTADLVDLQLCVLPHAPLTGPDAQGTRQAVERAMEMGVDLVGGVPSLDPDGLGHLMHTLDLATEAGVPMDLHIDETLDADMSMLTELAMQVIDRGFPHPVTASHCVSLGTQPLAQQRSVAALVAEAGISVVANPQTNLYLQGRDHPVATPRGLTAIGVLEDHGVVVAGGGDNVQDPFNLVGRADPLETAALLVAAGHLLPAHAYRLVSEAARAVMGLPVAPLAGDGPADLLAVEAPSIRTVVASGGSGRRVFKEGREICRTERTVTFPGR